MNTHIFADGFRFEKPKEGKPEFVKGRMSIQADKAIAFIEAHKNEKGWLNLDLLKSKEKGTLYFQLNTWKAIEKTEGIRLSATSENEINLSDIPF